MDWRKKINQYTKEISNISDAKLDRGIVELIQRSEEPENSFLGHGLDLLELFMCLQEKQVRQLLSDSGLPRFPLTEYC